MMSFPPKRLHGLRGFTHSILQGWEPWEAPPCAPPRSRTWPTAGAWLPVRLPKGIHGATENEIMVHIHLTWTICIYGNIPYFISMEIRKRPGN